MSFEVFVQCFKNGESASLPRSQVRDVFGSHLTEKEPELWQVRYNKANSCDLYLTVDDNDATRLRGFMVSRPCSDDRLWDALAAVLALGNVVLYSPDCRAPMVGRRSVAQYLPPEMVESLGQPVVVKSGKEIRDEIQAA